VGPQQQLTTGNGADRGMAHREWKIRNNDIELKLYFAMAHNTSLISYGIGGLVSLPLGWSHRWRPKQTCKEKMAHVSGVFSSSVYKECCTRRASTSISKSLFFTSVPPPPAYPLSRGRQPPQPAVPEPHRRSRNSSFPPPRTWRLLTGHATGSEEGGR
jgi:hypothetical protein